MEYQRPKTTIVTSKPIIREKYDPKKQEFLTQVKRAIRVANGENINIETPKLLNKMTDMELYNHFKTLDKEVRFHRYRHVNNMLAERKFYGFEKI